MAREITLAEFPVFLREKAEQFFEVKRQALSVWDQLHSDYPNWRVPDDARLAFFGRMVNHCDAIGFLLLAAADCLGDPDWWSRRVRVGTANDITIFLEETERTGRRYGFLNGWGQIEAQLRRMISAHQGGGGADNIYPACDKFYREGIKHPRASEIMNLINLATKTRNAAVHNDFTYYPRGKSPVTVVQYRGSSYRFEAGKQIDFFTWDFIHSILLDFLAIYEETVRHSAVSDMPFISSR